MGFRLTTFVKCFDYNFIGFTFYIKIEYISH
jgi:hypothetical protein